MFDRELLHTVKPWLKLLFVLVVAALIVFSVNQLMPILLWIIKTLTPFAVGLILAYVLHPGIAWLHKKVKISKAGSMMLILLILFLLVSQIFLRILPMLYQQIAQTFQDACTGIKIWLQSSESPFASPSFDVLKSQINDSLSQIQAMFANANFPSEFLKPAAKGGAVVVTTGIMAIGGAFSIFFSLLGWTGSFAFIMIITAYFLIDMDKVPEIIKTLLPESKRDRIWDILKKIDASVGGFLRGQCLASMILGGLMMVLFICIGMGRYALLLGIMAGIFNFIPYLGAIMGIIPAVLWTLMSSEFITIHERGFYIGIIIVGFIIIQAVDGLFSQPYIVGKHASLHPLMVIFALSTGAQFGIVGMIIAVPVACIIQTLWLELFWKQRRHQFEMAAQSQTYQKDHE